MNPNKFKKFSVLILAVGVLFVASGYKSGFFEIAKQVEIFTTLFKQLNMNYVDETNPAELMDTAIKNMLEDLDPYTTYMNEQDVETYRMNNAGVYSGIGALVRSTENKLIIIEPYKGYAADLAGLKAGDEILEIAGSAVADLKDDAVELLKGAKNSDVELVYKRQGETHKTTLTRGQVDVDAVPFFKMVDDKTGYIVLSRFNKKASAQTQEALENLKDLGAERIILDLRGNPGGLLTEAINVTNLFVPKDELIVTTRGQVKKFNKEYFTKKKPIDTEIPLAVLVNGRSASASEIVSGSLQDLDRAVVIGARSFGKGLVQRPMKLAYGTQLKVTISRYYTPSGRCIQALDYWHRDEKGNAKRNTQFNNYKTRNGRPVQDGGGVLPDIEIASLQSNDFTKALEANLVLFDYATQYHYSHQLAKPEDLDFTEADFNDFTAFVSKRGIDYQTPTEEALEKALAADDIALYGPEITAKYKALQQEIKAGKISALDQYQKELSKSLEDEIVKRYFYREGLYERYLKKDEAILAATELLGNPSEYQKILQ
ncbi:S41 family peptidase [Sediminicola luteus]|uniref:Peptidase S41 n=1 Tax=Sediminicola luteus TaxID=319238 RepID=A0A2A4GFG4_9FLAO|nr:S41 family peptidase [Sediminicola luteus]PCE66720.1 peptidase S41 [Sediminicola luteus]